MLNDRMEIAALMMAALVQNPMYDAATNAGLTVTDTACDAVELADALLLELANNPPPEIPSN